MNKALDLFVELGTQFTMFISPDMDIDAVLNRPLYRGTTKLKQLAYLKVNYKGKNENGGRSCKMITPSSYKHRSAGPCITWGSFPTGTPCWVPEGRAGWVPEGKVRVYNPDPNAIEIENIT